MPLVSIRLGAKELGCSQEHVRRMIRAGRWPYYQLGRKGTRIDVEEIRVLGKLIAEHEQQRRAENV